MEVDRMYAKYWQYPLLLLLGLGQNMYDMTSRTFVIEIVPMHLINQKYCMFSNWLCTVCRKQSTVLDSSCHSSCTADAHIAVYIDYSKTFRAMQHLLMYLPSNGMLPPFRNRLG